MGSCETTQDLLNSQRSRSKNLKNNGSRLLYLGKDHRIVFVWGPWGEAQLVSFDLEQIERARPQYLGTKHLG
jgi:hypothetical protein